MLKERKLIVEMDMDLELLLNIFYGNEKAIQWTKTTSDAVDGKVKKKVLRYLK